MGNKAAKIFGSSSEPYYPSTLPSVGKCVAAILKKPEEMVNKYLTVAPFATTTQREVLRIIGEEMGSKFQKSNAQTEELEKIGDEEMVRGDGSVYIQYIVKWILAEVRIALLGIML